MLLCLLKRRGDACLQKLQPPSIMQHGHPAWRQDTIRLQQHVLGARQVKLPTLGARLSISRQLGRLQEGGCGCRVSAQGCVRAAEQEQSQRIPLIQL
jgi:hypothetical protein